MHYMCILKTHYRIVVKVLEIATRKTANKDRIITGTLNLLISPPHPKMHADEIELSPLKHLYSYGKKLCWGFWKDLSLDFSYFIKFDAIYLYLHLILKPQPYK